jgi:hypothetical protein
MSSIRRFARALCAASAVLAGGCADVHALDVQCPAALDEAPAVSSTAAGWEIVSEAGKRPLDQVGLYLFHPRQKSSLVPDGTRRLKSDEVVTWRLTRGPKEEFWVACSYVGTTAMLARKLEPPISECAATYELLRSGQRLRLKNVTCK